jgi:hypothetical protein
MFTLQIIIDITFKGIKHLNICKERKKEASVVLVESMEIVCAASLHHL